MWQFQNEGISTWTELASPDVTITTSASPGNCSAMTETRVLTLILTSPDNGRKYRCYLRKGGTDHTDNIGDDGYIVHINSPLQPGLHYVLI